MSDKFERPSELADDARDYIIGVLEEPGRSLQTVWVDGDYGGKNKNWAYILAEAGIWEIDVVRPLDQRVEMPKTLDCNTGEEVVTLNLVDQISNTDVDGQLDTYEDALREDYDLVEKPAAAVLIEGATKVSIGIYSLSTKVVGEAFGFLNRFVPSKPESAHASAIIHDSDDDLGHHG